MTFRQLLRQTHFPLQAFFEAEESALLWMGEDLPPAGVHARQLVLLGTGMAAAGVLTDLQELRLRGEEPPALVHVDASAARTAFAAARDDAGALDALLPLFRPTAVLFDESLRGNSSGVITLEDRAGPTKILKGIAAVAAIRPPALRTLGEAYFVPPAVPTEGRARCAGSLAVALDPPPRQERGGPFWRLGHHSLWRLDVLPWNERLVLAALVGTASREALCLAPSRLLPRVGYVAEVARQLGRTLIGIPLDACPKEMRGGLRSVKCGHVPLAPSILFDAEGVL